MSELGQADLAALNDRLQARNHALAEALNRAGRELAKARAQLAQQAQPPLSFATMIRVDRCTTDDQGVRHASAEVMAGTRRLVVPVAASLNSARLAAGDTVMLNDAMVLVDHRGPETVGAVRTVRQDFGDGRLLVADGGGNQTVARRSGALGRGVLTPGDRVVVDPSGRLVLAALPGEDDAELVLEETPDITFADIGGLDEQISRIRDAVELPFMHRDLFTRYDLRAPKGVLLYGPPGNGKTLIAKAVAHALADGSGTGERTGVFLSVKGPELLNKFVGESERLVRQIFRRARERAADGRPVVVFIDEMDSLLRTRGSGVSSDVETTIVPQFLAELDGVERLDNVMVIGASNRVDMIDPAVLRPGRLDVKIRIDRPGAAQARAIVRHYLTDDLPLDEGATAASLTDGLVERVFARTPGRCLAQVRGERGGWQPLYLGDVVSGAMLRNIVDRAKTGAVKASLASGAPVAIHDDLLAQAVEEETRETRDSVLDADTVQWARVNGMEPGRITAIRASGQAAAETAGKEQTA